MGIFSQKGMSKGTIFGRGRFFVPGMFIVTLSKLEHQESRNPKKKKANQLICEHQITSFEGMEYQSVEGTKPLVDTSKQFKTGQTVTHVIDLDNELYGQGNAKEYMAAVYQAYREQVDGVSISYEEAVDFMSTPEGDAWSDQALENPKVIGLELRVECTPGTKNNGAEDFTIRRFRAFEGASRVAA